jgi:hypothetical protein
MTGSMTTLLVTTVRRRLHLTLRSCSSGERKTASSDSSSMSDVIKKYGVVATVFHSSVYCTTLASVFTAISVGVDVEQYIGSMPESVGSAGTLAVAWSCTAMTGPARGLLTVLATPRVARFIGWR